MNQVRAFISLSGKFILCPVMKTVNPGEVAFREQLRLGLQPVVEVAADGTTITPKEFTCATFEFGLRGGAVEGNHSSHSQSFGAGSLVDAAVQVGVSRTGDVRQRGNHRSAALPKIVSGEKNLFHRIHQ